MFTSSASSTPQIVSNNTAPGESDSGEPISFLQLPWVQHVLPFVTSLALHATIIIIAVLTIQVIKIIKTPLSMDQPIIADSPVIDAGPPGSMPNVGIGGDPLRPAAQLDDPETKSDGFDQKDHHALEISTPGGAAGDSSDAIIEAGPSGDFGGGGSGIGGAHGPGNGPGAGEGGAIARLGKPGGGAIGPHGPVFGPSGNAHRITFVCDASGSMINKMASLKYQLLSAIQPLRPFQSFGVIFFQDEKFTSLTSALLTATPENKRRADKFLEDVTTTGPTNPIPGIELAFKQHPQLIYLLTDGDFPDNNAVLSRVRELEKTNKVKINTIAFITSSDTDTAFLSLLQQISTETGGVFKQVEQDKLEN